MIDIDKINYFADNKKAEGKRVALFDGTDISLPGTVAVLTMKVGTMN